MPPPPEPPRRIALCASRLPRKSGTEGERMFGPGPGPGRAPGGRLPGGPGIGRPKLGGPGGRPMPPGPGGNDGIPLGGIVPAPFGRIIGRAGPKGGLNACIPFCGGGGPGPGRKGGRPWIICGPVGGEPMGGLPVKTSGPDCGEPEGGGRTIMPGWKDPLPGGPPKCCPGKEPGRGGGGPPIRVGLGMCGAMFGDSGEDLPTFGNDATELNEPSRVRSAPASESRDAIDPARLTSPGSTAEGVMAMDGEMPLPIEPTRGEPGICVEKGVGPAKEPALSWL